MMPIDPEVDAAYERLNRYFLIPETTLQIYAPLKPGYRHTDDAPRIAEAAWWGDLLTVGRAAVHRYFTRPAVNLGCGHPETCIGKVDENDTPHCLWCGDIQDMKTLVEHLGKVYSHITNGRISKPMTKPEEVIAVADDLETERTEAAVAEATNPISTIIVNGTPVPLRNSTVTYYDLVRHAGFKAGQVIRSVTYRRGPGGSNGTLRPGSYVTITSGMIFDATDTYPG